MDKQQSNHKSKENKLVCSLKTVSIQKIIIIFDFRNFWFAVFFFFAFLRVQTITTTKQIIIIIVNYLILICAHNFLSQSILLLHFLFWVVKRTVNNNNSLFNYYFIKSNIWRLFSSNEEKIPRVRCNENERQ